MAAAEVGLDEGDAGDRPLSIKSKDGTAYSINRKYALISNLITTSLEQDASAEEVPIPGVKGDILKFVVEYFEHHKGTKGEPPEKPLRSKKMTDVCKDPWDAQFIDRIGEQRQTLYDLILAANYMDIHCLLHLGCAKVASLIKGQPLEKIKDILDPNYKGDKSEEDKKVN